MLKGMAVLIVEDDPLMRILLRRKFQRCGAGCVLECETGEEALDRLIRFGGLIDVVVSEWNLPGMSGLELIERVRQLEPELPLLLVTKRADERSVTAAIGAGVSGYVMKPFSPDALVRRLRCIAAASNANTHVLRCVPQGGKAA